MNYWLGPRGCGSAAADLNSLLMFLPLIASQWNGVKRSRKKRSVVTATYPCLQLQRGRAIGRAQRDPGAQGVTAAVTAQWSVAAPQLTSVDESSLCIFTRGKAEQPKCEVMETESIVLINERMEGGEAGRNGDERKGEWSDGGRKLDGGLKEL